MNSSLQFLRYPLADEAIHIDFLRLRCGTEKTFENGVAEVRRERGEPVHSFVAFSEWDAVIAVPSAELYPRTLTDIYAKREVASSISGTSGYFAYLWKHPVNDNWRQHLGQFERSGPSLLTSFRFADWFRRDVGLGAELLFCDYLANRLAEKYQDTRAIVAHSLGWNDVILFTHADGHEGRLTELLADSRLTTLADCVGSERANQGGFSATGTSQIFAASYTHLLGGFERFVARDLALGELAGQIESARILVRVAPPHERRVRDFMDTQRKRADVSEVPSEMGHYSLSMEISKLAKDGDGRPVLSFIADTRDFIGTLRSDPPPVRQEPDTYAETTTIFRFKEPPTDHPIPPPIAVPPEVVREIDSVERVMGELPHLLRQLNVSPMTTHRFVSVLVTLLDHLSDPVRSSVVRHLSRFTNTIPDLIRQLDPDGIDDLCHVLEYAVGQAIDGIAQFQHDANALGLSGRGGYSRLIVAVEWYIHSTFARLGIPAPLPLITFGLRSGNAGSTRRYQVDIPFSVLFVPGRWHNLLHEVGHLAWQHAFGWMMESLAIYKAMEQEIRVEVQRGFVKSGRALTEEEARQEAEKTVHVDFLRSREILRELFPNYLIFALPCGAEIKEMDALTLRHMASSGHPSSVTRELLLAVVTHCLLVIMQRALMAGGPADFNLNLTDIQRARAWWGIWEPLRREDLTNAVREAIHAIGEAAKAVRSAHGERDASAAVKKQILESQSFENAVKEALRSAILVLSLRGRHFQDSEAHLPPEWFGRLLGRISRMQHEQFHSAYHDWVGRRFATWVQTGEIFPKHRDAFVWSRLLLASRSETIAGGRKTMMRTQLSVLLSMWHDATTEAWTDKDHMKLRRLVNLGLVRKKD